MSTSFTIFSWILTSRASKWHAEMGGGERTCGGHAFTCHVLAHRLVCALLQSALARIRLVDDSGTADSCCSRGSARYREKVPYYSRFERLSVLPPIETVTWPTGRQFTVELGRRKIRQLIEKVHFIFRSCCSSKETACGSHNTLHNEHKIASSTKTNGMPGEPTRCEVLLGETLSASYLLLCCLLHIRYRTSASFNIRPRL